MRAPSLRFHGACGLALAVEPDFEPLAAFLEEDLTVRKGGRVRKLRARPKLSLSLYQGGGGPLSPAIQSLKLADAFLESDPNWILLTANFNLNNLVVTGAEQVVLMDHSLVNPIPCNKHMNWKVLATSAVPFRPCFWTGGRWRLLLPGQRTSTPCRATGAACAGPTTR